MSDVTTAGSPRAGADDSLIFRIHDYWNERIHDLEMTLHPVGSPEFFVDLDEYRFDKLRYLLEVVDFDGFSGRPLLEVGCGIGTDLVRFMRGGARVTGIDLSENAIELARLNFELNGLDGVDLQVANGEAMPFVDETFDAVYAHGVIQYTADPARMIAECHRVLKTGGQAIVMVYNSISWLNALSKVMRVGLEHEDAPMLRLFSIGDYRRLLAAFSEVRIVPERFPVRSRLHGGWKGVLYNRFFVGAFNALPRGLVRPARVAPDGVLSEVATPVRGRRRSTGSHPGGCGDEMPVPSLFSRGANENRTYGPTCLMAETFIWQGLRQVGHLSVLIECERNLVGN